MPFNISTLKTLRDFPNLSCHKPVSFKLSRLETFQGEVTYLSSSQNVGELSSKIRARNPSEQEASQTWVSINLLHSNSFDTLELKVSLRHGHFPFQARLEPQWWWAAIRSTYAWNFAERKVCAPELLCTCSVAQTTTVASCNQGCPCVEFHWVKGRRTWVAMYLFDARATTVASCDLRVAMFLFWCSSHNGGELQLESRYVMWFQ